MCSLLGCDQITWLHPGSQNKGSVVATNGVHRVGISLAAWGKVDCSDEASCMSTGPGMPSMRKAWWLGEAPSLQHGCSRVKRKPQNKLRKHNFRHPKGWGMSSPPVKWAQCGVQNPQNRLCQHSTRHPTCLLGRLVDRDWLGAAQGVQKGLHGGAKSAKTGCASTALDVSMVVTSHHYGHIHVRQGGCNQLIWLQPRAWFQTTNLTPIGPTSPSLSGPYVQAEASRPGRRTKQDTSAWLKGPNIQGYHLSIINIGKSFRVVQFPWVDPSTFTAKITFPAASLRDIWKPNPISVLFPQQLTAMIYQHVPENFHELVDTADLPEFAANIHISLYFADYPHYDIESQASQDFPGTGVALSFSPRIDKKKISPYPPLIYHKNTKSLSGFMKNIVMPLSTHVILFGPASLEDKGSRRPQSQTLGQLWHIVELNAALISFVCTTSGKTKSPSPVGATSKIDFREIYMHFRWVLESKADDASTNSIIRFWHQHVFEGIASVPALPTTDRASECINEEAELEAAMGGLDVEENSLVYSNEEDFNSGQ
ncbi:hypothetical protein DFH08DRAFT_820063 [Mycena albidolilacea]|uniref:Uncharacterized protein n=1 Tax=Mycena albidolilacea TaxID=1033008 RepID=A0AAD6ZD12_9AGAR|nr:hypothetical protein DFH08DRAFT_820063 [Mycena albidolilacea]